MTKGQGGWKKKLGASIVGRGDNKCKIEKKEFWGTARNPSKRNGWKGRGKCEGDGAVQGKNLATEKVGQIRRMGGRFVSEGQPGWGKVAEGTLRKIVAWPFFAT